MMIHYFQQTEVPYYLSITCIRLNSIQFDPILPHKQICILRPHTPSPPIFGEIICSANDTHYKAFIIHHHFLSSYKTRLYKLVVYNYN